MPFLETMQQYYEGERLGAILFGCWGIFCAVFSIFLWRRRKIRPILHGLFYPLAFLGLFGILAGAALGFKNTQRLGDFPGTYQADPKTFIQNEVTRFEKSGGINDLWFPLKIMWGVFILTGLVLRFGIKKDLLRGVGIGLVILGASGMLLDTVSERRAKEYAARLLTEK